MTMLRAFLLAVAIGAGGMMVAAAVSRAPPARPIKVAEVGHALLDGISVTDQLHVSGLEPVCRQGYRLLIGLRPDGEETGQPPAGAIGEAAVRSAGQPVDDILQRIEGRIAQRKTVN